MEKRFSNISFLQFIGPILVILGHSANGIPIPDVYHVFSKVWIYLFHMPLFFFISGYLFSYRGALNNKSYPGFLNDKFQRLLIPYLIWNLSFIFPKILVSNFIVDEVSFDPSYLFKLIINPRAMIWGHTWFLAALFLLFVLAPVFHLLLNIRRQRMLTWTLVTVGLTILSLFPIESSVLALSDLSKNTLFFWIGMMFGQIPTEKIAKNRESTTIFALVLFLTIVFTYIRLDVSDLRAITIVTCLLTIICLFLLPIMFRIEFDWIDQVGRYSFGIYILHWPVMITVRILFYQVLNFNSNLVVFLMAALGYAVPYFIMRVVTSGNFNKFHKVRKHILGI